MIHNQSDPVDCACVIHGDLYPWIYVEHLHRMIQRNTSRPVRFHVFTEPERPVSGDMIRHDLVTWPNIQGNRSGWWYKIQMFDPRHQLKTRLLYFDLDVLITSNLDWIWQLDHTKFWAIRDFKYLWNPDWNGLNSSVMLWNTERFWEIWQDFRQRDRDILIRQYRGDQDYLNDVIDRKDLEFLNPEWIKSWRWQCKDGGLDWPTRTYKRPGTGTSLESNTKIIVFHGRPKPHEIHDNVVHSTWQ